MIELVPSIILTAIGVGILIYTSRTHTSKINKGLSEIEKALGKQEGTLREILDSKKDTSAKIDLLAEQFRLKVEKNDEKT